MNTFNDIIRAAGLKTLDRIYNSESLSKSAARMMDGKTHYFDAETMRYFGSSVSRLYVSHGIALVTLERASMDPNHTRKGYRVNIHDLTGFALCHGEHGLPSRPEPEEMTTSKAKADKWFAKACALVDAKARDILAAAINREVSRHARALVDLKTAAKTLRRLKA